MDIGMRSQGGVEGFVAGVEGRHCKVAKGKDPSSNRTCRDTRIYFCENL